MNSQDMLSDRYEIGETLGYGGMSEVHHGRDVRLDRQVAVKILRADLANDKVFQERFRREAQNSAALSHPAIVAVYDTGETQSEYGRLPYIVMEYVEGRTLRDIVKTEGPMDSKRAMEVMADVCAALDFSHRHGIIHRDVKPANVMISKAGAVKVMDFGIARAIHDGQSAMTQTAAVIGTAQYLSPEQARGESVDARSDVYAAGCVLYELLTGEPPFTGDSPVAVAYQHVREDAPPPSALNPAISPRLDAVVLKALTKGPANRYQSAAEMRSDLVRVLSDQRPSAPMVMTDDDRTQVMAGVAGAGPAVPEYDPDAEEDERRRRRRNIAIALTVLGVLAIVAFLWLTEPFGGEETAEIPNVIGQPRGLAIDKLKEVGFQQVESKAVKCVPPRFGEDPPCQRDQANTVLNVEPQVGRSVAITETITVEYAQLPEQFAMPKVTGKKRDDAVKLLEEQGLLVNPEVEEVENSDPKRTGKVSAQDPPAGEEVAEGDEVTLKVYAKPEMVEVKNYVDNQYDTAFEGLTTAGFEVERVDVDSDKPEGIVVRQNPAGGEEAVKGSTVTLEVSNGNLVEMTMPEVIDRTEQEAREALTDAGHEGEIEIVENTVDDPERDGLVSESSPEPGDEMTVSDKVILTVDKYEETDDGGGDQPPTTDDPFPPVPGRGRN